jgi:hypothetical protein
MTTPPFTQIDPLPWPSGYADAIAVVCLQPERLSRVFGLSFSEGTDNLDAYVAAAVRLRSGRVLGLLRHAGDPAPGTEIHVDRSEDYVAALREFLDAFDLSAGDLTWMREDVPAEHLRLAEAGPRPSR